MGEEAKANSTATPDKGSDIVSTFERIASQLITAGGQVGSAWLNAEGQKAVASRTQPTFTQPAPASSSSMSPWMLGGIAAAAVVLILLLRK